MELARRIVVLLSALAIGLAGCDQDPQPSAAPRGSNAKDSPSPMPSIGADSKGSKAHTAFRTEPREGEVVYYALHPNFRKVDRYCGAYDRSYVVRHVEVSNGDPAVLTRAVEALADSWPGDASRISEVGISGGLAIIDLRSMRGLGYASTSCGGVGFLGSLTRTVFQFDSVDSLQVHLAGSCRDFGEHMQSARCDTFTRGDV